MSPNPTSNRELDASAWQRFTQGLRRYFVTGLATLFPVALTLLLLVQIFKFVDGFLGKALGFQIPGLGLLVTIVVVLLVGVLSIHFFGRVLFRTFELLLMRVPIVRKVFPAVKQLAQFLFSEEARQTAFRRVVMVQYPRTGAYSLAFVTNESKTSATGSPQTLLTLLIPNPPYTMKIKVPPSSPSPSVSIPVIVPVR